MQSSNAIEELLDSSILRINDNNEVEITEGFLDQVVEFKSEISVEEMESRTEKILGVTIESNIREDILRQFLATSLAIESSIEIDTATLRRMATVVDQFQPTLPRMSGAPNTFLAVHPNRLPLLLDIHKKTMVYFWRENCPTCDFVREDLNNLFESLPEDLSLFTAYGPSAPELLQERYDVVGAPTIIFTVNGVVDMRLQGPYPTASIKSAVESYTDTSPLMD